MSSVARVPDQVETTKDLVGFALYIDALRPVSLLSFPLQSNDADIVNSIENTLKSTKAFQSLTHKDDQNFNF